MALHMMALYTPLTFLLVMFLLMLLCFAYPICKSPHSSQHGTFTASISKYQQSSEAHAYKGPIKNKKEYKQEYQ